MKRAFTLMELLVVLGIMAIMGSLTVAGYRQMKRGMEERSVMENVNQFIRSAYQRAQIDRQSVAVYFWNETLREASSETFAVVVGRAVAVRRCGRLSSVQGNELYDEFGDLEFKNAEFVNVDEDGEEAPRQGSSSSKNGGMRLYMMNGDEGSEPVWSVVSEETVPGESSEDLLTGGGKVNIRQYAFNRIEDQGSPGWKAGDAYGFEFGELTLPRGYIFGKTYSTDGSNPIDGHRVIRFKASVNSGDGATTGSSGNDTIEVSNLRPGRSGTLTCKSIGTTKKPTESID